MPKIVDHDQRRAEVLEATWRVVTSVGLHEATTRRIAQEAGYSNGVLAHYFTNKDDIVVSALQMVHARVRQRMEVAVQRTAGLEALRAVLLEALPLDEDRLFEAHLEFGYLSYAINATRLRDLYQEDRAAFADFLHTLAAAARARDELRPDVDDAQVVAEALVLIDGVSAQAVFLPQRMSPDLQQDLAASFLERVSARD